MDAATEVTPEQETGAPNPVTFNGFVRAAPALEGSALASTLADFGDLSDQVLTAHIAREAKVDADRELSPEGKAARKAHLGTESIEALKPLLQTLERARGPLEALSARVCARPETSDAVDRALDGAQRAMIQRHIVQLDSTLQVGLWDKVTTEGNEQGIQAFLDLPDILGVLSPEARRSGMERFTELHRPALWKEYTERQALVDQMDYNLRQLRQRLRVSASDLDSE